MIDVYLRSKISFVTSERSLIGNNSLDTVSNVINVLGGNTADRDSSVLSHVDVMLLNHSLGLLNGKSGEREHTNLGGDVRPVSLGSVLLESSAEGLSHGKDSIANSNELGLPLVSELNVVQKLGSNSSSVLGRSRVVSSD